MTPDDPNQPVLFARCANEFEAELKASILRAAGIEVRTVTAAAGAMRGVGPMFGAAYEVYVRGVDVDAAHAAIRAAKEAGGQADWAEGGEDDAVAGVIGVEEGSPARRAGRGLSAPSAFALGALAGMLTSPAPIVAAALLGAPLGRPEMTVLLTLWVITGAFLAYNIRERLPAPRPVEDADAGRRDGR